MQLLELGGFVRFVQASVAKGIWPVIGSNRDSGAGWNGMSRRSETSGWKTAFNTIRLCALVVLALMGIGGSPAVNSGLAQVVPTLGDAGVKNAPRAANNGAATTPQENGPANSPVTAQESPPQEPQPTVPQAGELSTPSKLTVESLQASRDAAVAGAADEEQKKRLGDLYQKAIDNLTQLNQLQQRKVDIAQQLSTVKSRAEQAKLQQQLETPPLDLGDRSSQSLAEIQAEATSLDQNVKQLKEQIAERTKLQTDRVDRRKELQELATSLPTTLQELKNQLQVQAPAGEAQALTKARRSELQTQISLLESRIPMVTLEQEWLEAEDSNDILRMQLDSLRTQLADKEKQLVKINEILLQKRKQEADKAAEAAAEESRSVDPRLQPLAEANEQLAKQLVEVTEKLAKVQEDSKTVSALLTKIQNDYSETQLKVKKVGLTDAIGHLLRKQRVGLPSPENLRKYRPNSEEISQAQLLSLQFEDARSDLVIHGAEQRIFAEGEEGQSRTVEETALANQENELLKKKKELLEQLSDDYDLYFTSLVTLDTNQRELLKQTRTYGNYLDERVLWIPSGKPIWQELTLQENDLWFIDATLWQNLGRLLLQDLIEYWGLWFVVVLILVVLNYRNMEYRRRISAIGREASSGSAMTFRPTVEALIYTILISLPWSALLIYLGWRLGFQSDALVDDTELPRQLSALATGFMAVGIGLLPLEALRHTCRDLGLGAAHFGWSTATLKPINRLLRLLNALGLPLLFITTTLYAVDPTFGMDLLERVCFVFGAALITFVVYRLLAPRNGILRNYYAANAGGWLDRLRYLWFALALAMPLFLAGLALLGYYYTACQLSIRLYAMFWLVICLLIGRELVARVILVGRRRSYIEQAKLRRAQAASTASSPEESEVSVATLIGSNKEWASSLSEQTKQSKNLLNSVVLMVCLFGIWAIWADVIPALRVVYQQPLWTTVETIAIPMEDNASADEMATKDVVRNITPTDLLQSMVVLVMTFVVFRNLPGLVDIIILNRLPLDPSTRNAVTAVCSYLVIVVGVVVAASLVGISWMQVQWLITALTFGLAFGLQEIFANFVAGVIILFERPIRVGDVVTVDDVTGVVTRTRARATTIRNWDLKEFIVPNKEFITGRVLNWTLSDQVTRLVIPVGVAYGSDTQKTMDLLLEAAHQHNLVLEDPAPLATFEEFGDSTLNFILRSYVAKLDDRLKVTSELHRAIDEKFRAANIEIAFPQRDLHIRSMPAEWKPQSKNQD